MGKKEELLAFISQMEIESKYSDEYGIDWIRRDYYGRWTQAAGEYCSISIDLAKAEAKAIRRPGSIGARKARQKAKKARRKQRELEKILQQKQKDYHPSEPKYIPGQRKQDTIGLIRKPKMPNSFKGFYDPDHLTE